MRQVKIDCLLEGARWKLTNNSGVPFEHALSEYTGSTTGFVTDSAGWWLTRAYNVQRMRPGVAAVFRKSGTDPETVARLPPTALLVPPDSSVVAPPAS